MKRDYDYYQKWYNKWIRVFRHLCDKCERTHRIEYLIQEVKKHIWLIEWRLLCVKWFDIDAESSSMFPKTLKNNKL